METLLADPVPAPAAEVEPASAPTAAGSPPEPENAAPAPQPAEHTCSRCGAAMASGQEWCLQCGAGVRGSLGSHGLRSAGAILAGAAVLALGAAAAGYAALNKTSSKPRTVTAAVAQAPAATPPPTAPPATATPLPKTLPGSTAKLPKIPLAANTPKAPAVAPAPTPTKTSSSTTTSPASTTTGGASSEEPSAIVLDTNAASTYNPYGYAAAGFGDPSLAIDGDPSTAWTAQVNPATAPRMAEGIVIDLKANQKLAKLALVTSTPGMTVQAYGATGKTVPGSITDPAWVKLSHEIVVAKKHAQLKLLEPKHGFRYVVLWISRAPASSTGTAQAPGHVDVNELELFAPS